MVDAVLIDKMALVSSQMAATTAPLISEALSFWYYLYHKSQQTPTTQKKNHIEKIS